MKKLVKIKLINWHIFLDETIDLIENTLVSGENGSGKSTLLDAIQYLLIGGKSGVKFNIAATDDARRTLEGYIRGRIGAENNEYLRSGDVVTHIALQFHDEQEQTSSMIGAVLELSKMGSIKERFYLLKGLEINDDLFFEGKYPRDYRSMKSHLKLQNIDLEPFESQKKYRESLARFLGVDARKYAKILPKALAFRPIDLQKFVFEFLLDDEPIDIASLKNNVAELKRVEAQIRLDREKLEKLDKIIDLGQNLVNNQEQVEINQLIEKISLVEQKETFLKDSEDLLDNVDNKLAEFKTEQEEINHLIDENEKAILELETARVSNDLGRTLQNYKDQLASKETHYTTQREVANNLRENLIREVDYLSQFIAKQPNTAISQFIKYFNANVDNLSVVELQHQLELVSREIIAYSGALQVDKAQTERDRASLAEELRIVQVRLNALKRNVKTYPAHVTNIINVLNEQLSKIYEKDVRVRPFCEMLEVNDETWRNALEGYLSGQRFDIIVDPTYFNDAIEIYEKVRKELNIYGVGLVNIAKILTYTEHQPNSLASKLNTGHLYAQVYANMLMGSVICVENVADLKKYPRSISKSCMTYSNYTARAMNPRIYEVPYIGQAATDLQIKLEEDTLVQLQNKLDVLNSSTDTNASLLRIIGHSKTQNIVAQNQIRYFDLVKQTRLEMIELEEKIADLMSGGAFTKVEEKLDSERLKKAQLRNEADELVAAISNARANKASILERIDNAKSDLEELIKEQRILSNDHPTKLNAAFAQFNALKQRFDANYAKISADLAHSNQSIKTQTAKAENEVINQMKNYIGNYHFGAAPALDELIEFEKEANLLKNNNLVKYEQDAIDLRRSSEISFKEEFVFKLRASIESAQQQISELNLALDGKTFGTDTYQLITRPSEDPQFKQYYNMIMSNDLLDLNELFTENLSKRNEVILMELFEKIASSDPEFDKLAYQYLDYRNYMSYDIEVINQNGNKSFFSKVAKEKSGGETQVPFYIVIAASFQQLLTKNKRLDSGCIVLFDEAFNKMDESRIDAMMKFYNSLSIQLLIAVPPQRVSDIVNYVNTYVGIVKVDDIAQVQTFKKTGIINESNN